MLSACWLRQEQKREGACGGSLIQSASGWVCLINRRRRRKLFAHFLNFFSVHNCSVHLLLYLALYVRSVLRHCPQMVLFSLLLLLLRIEYDAYRTDLEELNLGPRDANTLPKIEQSQQLFQVHKEKYDKMRNDVSIKLKFLEENKVSNYFSCYVQEFSSRSYCFLDIY